MTTINPSVPSTLPVSSPRPEGLPETHPELGRHLFSWQVPSSTKLLNVGLGVVLGGAILFLAGTALTGTFSSIGAALSLSVVVLYLGVWASANTPAGTECSVYEKGITDGIRTLHFDRCRLGLESTKHFVQASSGGTPLETDQSFEVLLLQDEVNFRIRGSGPNYAAVFDFFRAYVLPSFMARELAHLEQGQEIRCGLLSITSTGIRSQQEEKSASWEEMSKATVESGWIRIFASSGEMLFETLVSNPNGYTLMEVLTTRGLLPN
jgi:hypothetical protein